MPHVKSYSNKVAFNTEGWPYGALRKGIKKPVYILTIPHNYPLKDLECEGYNIEDQSYAEMPQC